MGGKRALCIGIDDYLGAASLNGCVNDARAWAEILREVWGFTPPDTELLLNKAATKSGIVEAMKTLLVGAGRGDVLVLTASCHGSYVADESGESYKEVLCPYDVEDDWLPVSELAGLSHGLARGVRLIVILDTAFSGTVTRASVSEGFPGLRPPDDRRVRYLSPALVGKRVLENPWKARPEETSWPGLVITSCSAKEYAYDAFIGGAYGGAFSHYAVRCMREAGDTLSAPQLLHRTTFWLDEAGYPQHPQLVGKIRNKKTPLFA